MPENKQGRSRRRQSVLTYGCPSTTSIASPSYLGLGFILQLYQVGPARRRVLLSLPVTGSAAPSSLFEGRCSVFLETTPPKQCQTSRTLHTQSLLCQNGAGEAQSRRRGGITDPPQNEQEASLSILGVCREITARRVMHECTCKFTTHFSTVILSFSLPFLGAGAVTYTSLKLNFLICKLGMPALL